MNFFTPNSRLRWVLLVGLLVLIMTTAYILLNRPDNQSTDQPAPASSADDTAETIEQPLSQPLTPPISAPLVALDSLDLPPAAQSTRPLRIGRVQFDYPDNWIPLFDESDASETRVYFASSESEAEALTDCIAQQSCTDYALRLEGFPNLALPVNQSLEETLAGIPSTSSIPFDQLTAEPSEFFQEWQGFTEGMISSHYLVRLLEDDGSRSLLTLTATSTEPGHPRLNQYLAQLETMEIVAQSFFSPDELLNPKAYSVTLSASQAEHDLDSAFLTTMLNNLLAAAATSRPVQSFLFYDATQTDFPNDPLNHRYQMLSDVQDLVPGTYGSPQLRIELSPAPHSGFEAYLEDVKYCQQPSDCTYRSNFCDFGAFNAYHFYHAPWGCGMPSYEGLTSEADTELIASCETELEVSYDTLGCVNNQCQATNPKLMCKP